VGERRGATDQSRQTGTTEPLAKRLSERRACIMLGASRMTVRYRPRRLDDAAFVTG
jgi:hypothetical protein